jgi:hypothetical protein
MRLRDFAVVCLCWVIFGGLAEAQESRTLVTVAAPAKMDGKEFDKVRIAVNGRVKTIDPGKTAEFSVAASEGEDVDVHVWAIRKGVFSDDTVQTWTAAIPLSGSGHLDYTALSFGRGTWGQWPLVVFQSNGTVFDILLDGRTLGTIGVAGITEIKRGIQPNQGHTLAWRISANDVCTKNVTLPESVSRTYVCDAKTKQVAER